MSSSSIKTQLFLILVILGLTAIGIWLLFSLKQRPVRQPEAPVAPLVQTERIVPMVHQLQLRGYGTLEAWQHIDIRAQVGGEIIEVPANLQPGFTLKKGDLLAQVDPTEYSYLLEQERANLAAAELALKEEEGRQQVAQREWKLLSQKASGKRSLRQSRQHLELALRTAHLKEKESALAAARSAVKLAKLTLQRATLTAPCDGAVLTTNLALGQVISANTVIAEYACMTAMRLIVSLPNNQLRHLPDWPEGEALAATVSHYPAKALYRLPQLAQGSQMQQILLQIPMQNTDKDNPTSAKPNFRIGQYVQARIDGKIYNDVYKIPKSALRKDNHVWLLDENNTLALKRLEILQSTSDTHFAIDPKTPALSTQDRNSQANHSTKQAKAIHVITSIIDAPYAGMPLRTTAPEKKPDPQ